jgi:hypothetical protein
MFRQNKASEETKRNFCELFSNFFTGPQCFCLLQSAKEPKQNFFILKKLYQNEFKTFQIAPKFFKDKAKLLVVDENYLVRIENVLF